MAQTTAVPTYRELSREEARDLFDELARHHLNTSGEESLREWDAGTFAADLKLERPEVMALAFHLPLVRCPASSVAGRTPALAVQAFVDPLQRAISCVTDEFLGGGCHPATQPHMLTIRRGEPSPLGSRGYDQLQRAGLTTD